MNDNQLIILRTACQLFSQYGYDAIGVQQVVEKAGFTKPTLYHYFGSKQGLLEAILAYYLTPFNQQLSHLLPYHGDVQTSLRQIFDFYLTFAHTNTHFFRMWMAFRLSPIQSIPYQSLLPYLKKHQIDFNHLFQTIALQHGNLRGRESVLSASLQGLLFTFASLSLQDEFEFTHPRNHQIIHQFMHGIFS